MEDRLNKRKNAIPIATLFLKNNGIQSNLPCMATHTAKLRVVNEGGLSRTSDHKGVLL